jgi:phospholipid/cholesterol/gamma-HCH transport system ATP-binding protein
MTRDASQTDLTPAAASTPPEPIVRLVKVTKRFGRQQVLTKVSLEFARGRTTVVLGPSGCGKSVMLKHIIGLIKPSTGQVWYEQTRIDALSEARLGPIRQQFGVLFQQGALFDSLSVGQNVAFPLIEHTRMHRSPRERRVKHVLRLVGLSGMEEKMPAELSGGQQKRVALARAIILRPRVILYDEPTTGLDPIRADVINELILKLKRELQVTSIVVTHDLSSAFKVADEMVMLYDGKILLRGLPDTFRASDVPLVRRFLQGEATPEELAEIRPQLKPAREGMAAEAGGSRP